MWNVFCDPKIKKKKHIFGLQIKIRFVEIPNMQRLKKIELGKLKSVIFNIKNS